MEREMYELRIKGEDNIREEFSYYAENMGSTYEVGRVWGVDKYGNPIVLREIHIDIVKKEKESDNI